MLFHLKNRYQFAEIVRKDHEIAAMDQNLCTGCGKCQNVCQFGGVLIIDGKAEVNSNCQMGVCRRFCPQEIIHLSLKL